MEPCSGRRLRLSSPLPHGSSSPRMDLISALPDEMLLLVLSRLRCVRAAAQTSLLSRHWRGLWKGLPDLTFRGLTPTMIQASFCHLPASPYVSTLDIGLSSTHSHKSANSLLLAAVRLSPGRLIFTLQKYYMGYLHDIDLPCFQGTISIELNLKHLGVKLLPGGQFTALESLSVTGKIIGLRSLLNRCPRLRVLSVSHPDMCFSSTTLPPASELPTLEKLSLSGKIVDLRHLLDSWSQLQELSVTQQKMCFTPLPGSKFSSLKRLCISGLAIVDIAALVIRCPYLRVLNLTVATSKIMVHSVYLQELYVSHRDGKTECHNIDIVTPVLKLLDLDVLAARDIGVSISAPKVEKVSWHSSYTPPLPLLFGSWRLQIMSIRTMERSYIDSMDTTCWQQLPRFHVLWLRLSQDADNHLDEKMSFAREMEKLPVTNFLALDLNFVSPCHAYGSLVLQLLRIRRICAVTKKLKIFLPFGWEEMRACLRNCPCNELKNWRSQNIFYTILEEVEIYGFYGEDHDLDFLRLIFRCSPMLKRLTMRLTQAYGGCTTELSDIFLAHPFVKCSYDHDNSSGIFRPRISG